MRKSVPLLAGKETRLPYPGRVLQFVDLGAASEVDIKIETGSTQDVEDFGSLDKRFKLKTQGFTAVLLTSVIDTTVDLLITYQDVNLDGQTVIIDASQFPLDVQEGAASSAVAGAPVAVTSAGAVLVAASALRKSVRYLNLGPDPVAIGPAGQTWANRALVLAIGESFLESEGANLAWTGITNAGTTASVAVQQVLS